MIQVPGQIAMAQIALLAMRSGNFFRLFPVFAALQRNWQYEREACVQSFRLKLTDDGIGLDKFIDFDAQDAGAALEVLDNEVAGRRAELWSGERFVCSLSRDREGGGFWQVNPRD